MAPSTTPKANFTFLKHAGVYLSADLLSGVLSFVTVAILTRLLAPSEYGVLGVFVAVAAFSAFLFELNFRGAFLRYRLEETDDFEDFLRTNLIFLGAVSVALLGGLWALRAPMGRFVGLDPELFFLAVLAAALRVPWNLNCKLLVAEQHSGSFARLQVVRQVILFVMGVAWVYLLSNERYMGQVYATLVIGGFYAALLLVRMWRSAVEGGFRRKHLVYALAFSLPMLPHSLSGSIIDMFDRVIINQIDGNEQAGMYTFAYQIGGIMSIVVVALNQSWQSVFANFRREGKQLEIESQARQSSILVCLAGVFLILFSQELVMAMGGDAYSSTVRVIPIIVLGKASVFAYSLYANYSFYANKTWYMSIATILAGVANVAMNYWAIPIWGIIGAAWTTLISYLLLFAGHYAFARFLLPEPVIRLRVVLPGLMVLMGGVLLFELLRSVVGDYWVLLLAVKVPIVVLASVVGYRVFIPQRGARA